MRSIEAFDRSLRQELALSAFSNTLSSTKSATPCGNCAVAGEVEASFVPADGGSFVKTIQRRLKPCAMPHAPASRSRNTSAVAAGTHQRCSAPQEMSEPSASPRLHALTFPEQA